MSLLTRLARMERREIAFRAATAGRGLAQRLSVRLRRPEWDYSRADAILARPFAGRARPRLFPLHPEDVHSLPGLVRERFPLAAESARQTADRILDGRLHVLGYPDVHVGMTINWHRDPVHDREAPRAFWSAVPFLDPALGDHKVIWEINRHQHWLALGRAAWLTGDPSYARAIVSQLDSWLEQNPPFTGINWASMLELAFRSLSWLWTIPFLLSQPIERDWLPRLLVALDAQLEHVRHNLSRYFSPNTHLLGEALALYVAGRALPELKRSTLWADTGRRILIEQIGRQVNADGGHAELSTHYHRYALDFYLLALAIARLTSDDLASNRFEEVAGRLARYARALADDRGHLPLIGDDDGGQLFPICGRDPADASPSLAWAAALLDSPSLAVDPGAPPEETFWLTANDPARVEAATRPAEPILLQTFPDSGYVVARTRRGDHLVFDAGPHGFLNGGHAHDDALSCVLTLARRMLVIDPGTFTYTMDPALRDRLRASTSHNTLTLDGRAHSEPAGPFHWRSRARGTLVACATGEHGAWMTGHHDAFAPVRHRRDLFVADDGLVVVIDRLTGDTTEHEAECRWTLDPAWDCSAGKGGARLIHRSGAEARIVSTTDLQAVKGGSNDGWCAPVYGQLLPTWTLIGRTRRPLPLQIVTLFSDGSVPPDLQVEEDADGLQVIVIRAGLEDAIVVGASGLSHRRRETRGMAAGTHRA